MNETRMNNLDYCHQKLKHNNQIEVSEFQLNSQVYSYFYTIISNIYIELLFLNNQNTRQISATLPYSPMLKRKSITN